MEALAFLAENGDFDMVVSDINMPRMDGLTLLAKLQEEATRFSTVIVSAYGDMANIRTAMNRGAFDFLTKPIDFADFETTRPQDDRACRRRSRDARDATGGGGARARVALALFLAQSRAQPRRPTPTRSRPAANGARSRPCSPTSPGSRRWSNSLDPRELASLLSGYLEGMTEIVFAHEGTVAKIIGDAIHVLFGAPAEQPDAATRAIACALALDACAEDYRLEWKARGVPLGVTRIGVHAGPAIVGNFGGGRLFDYTAYGDTDQRRGAARGGQQAARHAHLRQRRRRRAGGRVLRPPGRRSRACAAGASRCAPTSR